MVYVYREVKTKGKRSSSKWLGPATVIGPEGSNYWVARGGRYLFATGEHLRLAEHAEVSEAIRIKAALNEVKKVMDNEFEQATDTQEFEDMEVDDLADLLMFDAENEEGQPGPEPAASSAKRALEEDRLQRALQAEERHRVLAKQTRALDDVPVQIRKYLRTQEPGEVAPQDVPVPADQQFYVKRVKSPEALEKAFDKEIPWNMIDPSEKELYVEAEKKQWQEHLDFEAVRPLSVEESRKVEATVDRSHILNCRFLYRDKTEHVDVKILEWLAKRKRVFVREDREILTLAWWRWRWTPRQPIDTRSCLACFSRWLVVGA